MVLGDVILCVSGKRKLYIYINIKENFFPKKKCNIFMGQTKKKYDIYDRTEGV